MIAYKIINRQYCIFNTKICIVTMGVFAVRVSDGNRSLYLFMALFFFFFNSKSVRVGLIIITKHTNNIH